MESSFKQRKTKLYALKTVVFNCTFSLNNCTNRHQCTLNIPCVCTCVWRDNSSEEVSPELLDIVVQDMSLDSEPRDIRQRAGEGPCRRKEYRMLTTAERQGIATCFKNHVSLRNVGAYRHSRKCFSSSETFPTYDR